MKNLKIISTIATFSAIASFVFVAISAISTYFLIQITSSGAPAEYIAFNIVSLILPYLFVGVLSLVVAVMTKDTEEKSPEKEALPPIEPEANA